MESAAGSGHRGAPAGERLARALSSADEVLFVCSGNILRSAFAELWARHLLARSPRPLAVRSGATCFENRHLHPAAERALLERGVARAELARFRPTPFRELAAPGPGTLVLGMTRAHLAAFRRHASRFLLTELAPGAGGPREVPDPIDLPDPRPVLDEVARCVEALVRLRSGDGAGPAR